MLSQFRTCRLLVPIFTVLLLTLLSLLTSCPLEVSGAHLFDAYRLIQYDRGTTPYGSRRTILNQPAQVQTRAEAATAREEKEWTEARQIDQDQDDEADELAEPITKAAVQDLSRRVIVVRIAELSPAKVRSFVSRGATGILIVLPTDLSAIPQADVERYQLLEQYLVSTNFDAAIYFAFEDQYLAEMVQNLEFTLDPSSAPTTPSTHPSSTDRYQLQVSTADATLLTGVTVSNFHGMQHAAPSSTADSDTLPTIAIVANYDSIGIVPGLSSGLDQNGSGTLALLELTRIFHTFYSDFRTQGNYNLLFILTGMDRLNFVGTKNWLRNIDSRVLESLEFALCLERIATAPVDSSKPSPLFMHVSKMPKTPEIQTLYGQFQTTATEMKIPFELVHKKINISNPNVFWQHEQFSRKRIVAATLSSEKQPQIMWQSGSIFKNGANTIDLKVLERNIKFIVESLAKQIYGLKAKPTEAGVIQSGPIEVLDSSSINSHQIQAYMKFFNTTSRFTSLITEPKTHAILNSIENHFKSFTLDVKKQSFSHDQIQGGSNGLKFYKDKEGGVDSTNPRLGVVEMQAFQVKPFIFDVYLTGGILVYLLVVYIACKQPSNMGDVIAVLIGR